MKFAGLFDPNSNGLNSIRLLMAVGVIFWHSFPLSGSDIEWEPARQLMANVFVDGFFAISGFLIVRSWLRRPDAKDYLVARIVRIVPAYYVCLLVTGFVFVPVYILLTQSSSVSWLAESSEYVLKNLGLWQFQSTIGDTLSEVPYPGSWNGSLWTLGWEFVCYLGVLALGIARLLTKRVCVGLFGVFVAGSCVVAFTDADNFWLSTACRFGLMFMSGSLFYFFQDRIPATRFHLGLAGAVLIASMFLPDYRIIGSFALAYVCLTGGALLKHQSFHLKNDVSYGMYIYAFPVQQLLATMGLHAAPVAAFATVSMVMTLCLAAGSCFLVEQPANSLRKRLTMK